MNFDFFTSNIPNLQKFTAAGLDSQFKMAPYLRLRYNSQKIKELSPKKAAVLALFYPNFKNETCFLLTLRASYQGLHAAQISFPGGKFDEIDKSLEYTALRETHEEVGIPASSVKIIKEMTQTFIAPSNFLVNPFLGTLDFTPKFIKNSEVEEIIEVKVSDLLDDSTITTKNLSTSYMKNIDVPCFNLNNYIVWGATAMMLSEIKDLLKLL
ncbi:MAG: CoA pyrophosphatase [Bacteroidota bacterium]